MQSPYPIRFGYVRSQRRPLAEAADSEPRLAGERDAQPALHRQHPGQLCGRLRDEGIPVSRATMHFRTHHPQWLGARILWNTGLTEAKITTFDYGIETRRSF
jgi:hypothetical protein